MPSPRKKPFEALPILRQVNGIELAAQNRYAKLRQRLGEVDCGLAAKLNDDRHIREAIVRIRFVPQNLDHALHVERFEIESVRRIEICRHRLWIRVDHDRSDASIVKRARRLNRRIVELDALPDADWARPHDDGPRPAQRRGLILRLVGRIEVRRGCRKLTSARVHHLVNRQHSDRFSLRSNIQDRSARKPGDRFVAEPGSFRAPEELVAQILPFESVLHCHDTGELVQKPAIDTAQLEESIDGKSAAKGRGDGPKAKVIRPLHELEDRRISPARVFPQQITHARLE